MFNTFNKLLLFIFTARKGHVSTDSTYLSVSIPLMRDSLKGLRESVLRHKLVAASHQRSKVHSGKNRPIAVHTYDLLVHEDYRWEASHVGMER